jgi:hypothetical protein
MAVYSEVALRATPVEEDVSKPSPLLSLSTTVLGTVAEV